MKPLLLLLAAGLLLQGDSVAICTATATDPLGNVSPVACDNHAGARAGASITVGTRALDVFLLDYAYGDALTSISGASLSVSLDWEASANAGQWAVFGGSGNGELVLTEFSDYQNFGGGGPFSTNPQMVFTSTFLPTPPFGYHPMSTIYVPFTFGVPLNLYVDASITLSDTVGAGGVVAWESIIQDDVRLTDILNSNGNSAASAFLAPVPEPSSILLLLISLFTIGVSSRLRRPVDTSVHLVE